KQAGNAEFMRSFARALERTGFPRRFMIEVTEDAFVAKTHFQTEILPIFRQLGVGISIDDFGIGYSSLSALADITADEPKWRLRRSHRYSSKCRTCWSTWQAPPAIASNISR